MKALIVTLTLIGSLTLLGTLPAQVKVLTKQEQATRAFESLTGRMQKLRVTLKSTDPEKAKIIGLGAKFIEETALTSAMKDIETLLAEESWDKHPLFPGKVWDIRSSARGTMACSPAGAARETRREAN